MTVAATTDVIREPASAPFGVDLATRVGECLDPEFLRDAHRRLQRKAALILAWYVASYVAMLAAPNVWVGAPACVSLGLSMAAVGFNIQHDASHNALFFTSGRRRLSAANRAAAFSLNAIGGDAGRWVGGHVRRHHSAPNVVGRDDDINLGIFARLAPTQTRRPWHRFQHLYLWALYALSAVLIIVGDITATVAESFSSDPARRPTSRTYAVLAASKVSFLAALLGVPLVFHTGWSVLIGAAAVAAAVGVLLGVVFQLAHTVTEAEFRDSSDAAPGRWHQWQVQATVDFCHGNGPVSRAVTWFAGGLNYQVEHHLFPQVPHTAYPHIAATVSLVCSDHEIPHRVQPTLRAAVRSHYRHLRALGRPAAS